MIEGKFQKFILLLYFDILNCIFTKKITFKEVIINDFIEASQIGF